MNQTTRIKLKTFTKMNPSLVKISDTNFFHDTWDRMYVELRPYHNAISKLQDKRKKRVLRKGYSSQYLYKMSF